MPNYPRKETETTFNDMLTISVSKDMYHLPFRYKRSERIYGRMEILKRWFEVDFPNEKIYLNLDNITKEVVISLPRQSKRIKKCAFLKGSTFKLYVKLKKQIREG